jgi:hypothetical protein
VSRSIAFRHACPSAPAATGHDEDCECSHCFTAAESEHTVIEGRGPRDFVVTVYDKLRAAESTCYCGEPVVLDVPPGHPDTPVVAPVATAPLREDTPLDTVIEWVAYSHHALIEDAVPCWFKGFCDNPNEGVVGFDVKARPLRMGPGKHVTVLQGSECRMPEGVLLLEPRDAYDVALVDLIESECAADQWPRKAGWTIAVYDAAKCLKAIKRLLNCDDETAQEWFDFNTSGAWVGEGTPTFRYPEDDDDAD